jgi:hypothetical protein
VRRRRWAIPLLALIGMLVVVLVAVPEIRGYLDQGLSRARGVLSREPAAPLTDLRSMRQLSAAFNEADGRPRLVLFLAPT